MKFRHRRRWSGFCRQSVAGLLIVASLCTILSTQVFLSNSYSKDLDVLPAQRRELSVEDREPIVPLKFQNQENLLLSKMKDVAQKTLDDARAIGGIKDQRNAIKVPKDPLKESPAKEKKSPVVKPDAKPKGNSLVPWVLPEGGEPLPQLAVNVPVENAQEKAAKAKRQVEVIQGQIIEKPMDRLQSNVLEDQTQNKGSKTQSDNGDVMLKLVSNQENVTKNTNSYSPQTHPDRFKFIYRKERISKAGPKINPDPESVTFHYELEDQNVCNDNGPFILAVVITAVKKRPLREFIRRTWANPRLYPYTKIKSVFIMGSTLDAQLQNDVDEEYAKYKDVIQYNYIDTYTTLTYKSMAMLVWVGKHCPQAMFIAKIDDDVMVNPFHLKAYFQDTLKNPPIPKRLTEEEVEKIPIEPGDFRATHYIYGRYDADPYPLRYTKWAVTQEEYPEKNYPPFVHGPAYVLGRKAAKLMLEYAPYVPYVRLEDVFTTGLVAHAAQVKHVQIFGVVNTFKANIKLYNGTQALMEETGPKSRLEAWEGIVHHAPVDINALGTPFS